MFKLTPNPFRVVPFAGLLFLIVVTTEVNAQFDSIIFLDTGYYVNESVIFMGDQNDDGCDDFIICRMNMRDNTGGYAYFFYGGNPVPDTPAFRLEIYYPSLITGCDLNQDGYRDIINHIGEYPEPVYRYNVYYGGPDLDTISDYVLTLPDSTNVAFFIGKVWPIDFDGDSWEELVYLTGGSFKTWFVRNFEENQPLEFYSIPRIGNMSYSEARIFFIRS